MRLFRLNCMVPSHNEDIFTAFLTQNVSWGWETEPSGTDRVRFIVYLDTDDAAMALIKVVEAQWPQVECVVTPFEDRDWSESWKEYFVPVRVGKTFVVLPPWQKDTEGFEGLIPVYIEPKMAFGTGHHATTALCLEAVARLWAERAVTTRTVFLDLGTGSGILGLACAKLGLAGLGLDIDPVAVDNAQENTRLNKAEGLLEIRRGGLEALESGRRFGLILANILSGPLVRMAKSLLDRLEPGGCLVLSGILSDQAARVEQAYQDFGLPEPLRIMRGEWIALAWGPSFAK